MKQQLRIIGGLYKGKKIYFPDIEHLRPTPDRVRETLFNWLMHKTPNSVCLDAFAGSGALGFEAFSRGASQVIFLEHAIEAVKTLKKTIAEFKKPGLKAFRIDTIQFLQECKNQFDIIFLDPPFTQTLLPQCLKSIEQNNILKPGGYLYVESATLSRVDELIWNPVKCKKAGQVYYRLFQKLVKEIP